MIFTKEQYYTYIQKKLIILGHILECNAKINHTTDAVVSEDFYCNLLNLVFDRNYVPTKKISYQFDSIDLIDENNKEVVQISTDKSKSKLDKTLSGDFFMTNKGYHLVFLLTINNGGRSPTLFLNPHSVKFSLNDYFDVIKLCHYIDANSDISKMEAIYKLISREVKLFDETGIYSSLQEIILKIYEFDSNSPYLKKEVEPFKYADKIGFNNLNVLTDRIADCYSFYPSIDTIFSNLNEDGVDAAAHVFSFITDIYLKNKNKTSDNVELFFEIVELMCEEVSKFIKTAISIEKLHDCCVILAVYCFCKCKIFENPSKGANN